MDTFLVLMCITSALIVIATLIVYERMLRVAREERDRAIDHADQCQALLTAVNRHPSVRRLPALSVIEGGNAS